MRYADRDGNIYEEENGQDRLLHWMYTTMAGRDRPWVSKLGGAFLSSPISKCLIKGFVKNNHIDMSEYEKKNYKSYNEFFSRKIKEGKRPFPEDKTILGSPCDCKVSDRREDIFCCKGYKIYVGFIDQKPQDRKTFSGRLCRDLTPDSR